MIKNHGWNGIFLDYKINIIVTSGGCIVPVCDLGTIIEVKKNQSVRGQTMPFLACGI